MPKLNARHAGFVIGKALGRFMAQPPWSKAVICFVVVALFIFYCVKLYQEQVVGEQKWHAAEAAERQAITNQLKLATYDRARGKLDLALEDLAVISESSPDHTAAQSMKYDIEKQIQERVTPQTEKAKQSCRKLVETSEEFPSTVDFVWFGTETTIDAASRTIAVAVDYSAKNSVGADLPYRMACDTNYGGDVVSYHRTGR